MNEKAHDYNRIHLGIGDTCYTGLGIEGTIIALRDAGYDRLIVTLDTRSQEEIDADVFLNPEDVEFEMIEDYIPTPENFHRQHKGRLAEVGDLVKMKRGWPNTPEWLQKKFSKRTPVAAMRSRLGVRM